MQAAITTKLAAIMERIVFMGVLCGKNMGLSGGLFGSGRRSIAH
ncbi:hypothetical protein BDW_06360 [Bdellovibrio bacteriovorus W]|nr:hypothetical protein BDW_06360 [Bdellovibrio bacteriovorus W]